MQIPTSSKQFKILGFSVPNLPAHALMKRIRGGSVSTDFTPESKEKTAREPKNLRMPKF